MIRVFADYAPLYVKAGLSPLPLKPGEKRPAIKEWQRYCSSSLEPETLAAWTEQYAAYGIGLALGREVAPGLFLVAVDVDAEDVVGSVAAAIGRSTPAKIGKKGRTFFVLADLRTSKNQKIKRKAADGKVESKPSVEILGPGSQVVLPPTIHPDTGEPYRWVGPGLLPSNGHAGFSHLPILTEWALDEITAHCTGKGEHFTALNEMTWLGVGGGGNTHDTCVAAVASLVARGWDDTAILERIKRAKREACERASERFNWPEADSVIAGWISSAQAKRQEGAHNGGPGALKTTDLGNAERLIQRHGEDLRYVWASSKWLVWDGTRWVEDPGHLIEQRAANTVRAIYAELGGIDSLDARAKLASHAIRSESAGRIGAMIDLARSQPSVPIMPEELDADPWFLNCSNGTLDLRTGRLLSHDRAHLITKQISTSWDPDAKCPLWMRTLEQIFEPHPEFVPFLGRAIGYALTGDTREHVLFVLYGGGRNGKTTILETVRALLGDYAKNTGIETFVAKKGESVNNDLAALAGRRFVTCSEGSERQRLNESLIKDVTGGGTVSARFLFEEWFDFKPAFKVFMCTNHRPVIRGTDPAIWARVRMIPFDVSFLGRENKDLPSQLQTELPGILRWAVEGCLEWQRDGLQVPDEVEKTTQELREDNDPLRDFVNECLMFDPKAVTPKAELYLVYKEWCRRTGESDELPRNDFSERVGRLPDVTRDKIKHKTVPVFRGIRATGNWLDMVAQREEQQG